jgi:aldose sugar dehydrogenase
LGSYPPRRRRRAGAQRGGRGLLTVARPASAIAALLILSACGSTTSPTPHPTHSASSTASHTPTPNPCDVAQQPAPPASIPASFPTALAFAPDGRLFYAERAGTVRVWQGGSGHDFASVSTVTAEHSGGYSERGLLGLALSPTFTRDHYVYGFYSDTNYTQQHVIRWTDCAGTSSAASVLITLPSGSDCCHKGGRIAFGPDGKLYVTLGDEHDAPAAQNTSDQRGKILRYNPDGSIPADNPFGASNPVWAYGLRNPFGIAFSGSGQLAVTSNGPSGDSGSPSTGYDTLILSVTRGARYQWANCYGYSHSLLSSSCGSNATPPDWSSETSTVVPTGAAFIDSSGPSGLANHLVFCTLNAGMLIATPGSPHATVTHGPSGCRLAVVEGPDHAVYVTDTGSIARMS